jgi:hypothetical protein
MAGMLYATPGPGFVGHRTIFQFVNDDGTDKATACGQCAIATVLANRNRIDKSIDGLRMVEKAYPADVASGAAGTSANRVKRALTEKKLEYYGAAERKGLEDALRRKSAAIALVQNTAGLAGSVTGPAGSWYSAVIAKGCTSRIMAAHHSSAWSNFEEMWSSPISVIGGMGKGVICC